MEREAIDRVVELAHAPEIEHNGHRFTARTLKLVTDPVASPLTFHTLQGLADYIDSGMENIDGAYFAVHVLAPGRIDMVSRLNDDQNRDHFAQVELADKGFVFGEFHEHERAMIGIQSLFVDTPERANLLKVLGSITNEEIGTLEDDGVTQKVTAKAGVHLVDRVKLPSPVTLRPYRTFREVEQPASEFILRVKKIPPGTIGVALFEADGGAWKIKAIENVSEWLTKELPDGTQIFA